MVQAGEMAHLWKSLAECPEFSSQHPNQALLCADRAKSYLQNVSCCIKHTATFAHLIRFKNSEANATLDSQVRKESHKWKILLLWPSLSGRGNQRGLWEMGYPSVIQNDTTYASDEGLKNSGCDTRTRGHLATDLQWCQPNTRQGLQIFH